MFKVNNKIGIVSYGYYVPKLRIKTDEIANTWGKDAAKIKSGLGVHEKALGAFDEDSATIAVQAARMALENKQVNPQEIGAIYVGSESKPYAVKPTATIVSEAIKAGPHLTAADLEFACKAGTAGIQACIGLVSAQYIKYGLAIGSDTSQGRPGDALEFSTGSGGAAYIIGNTNTIADVTDMYSFTTDTPDFWRRQHAEFPSHAGRFTGEPGYFKHVTAATKGLFERTGTTPNDYNYVVFHQPNGKFPIAVAKILGIPKEKIEQGLLTPLIGNTYSAAAMLGLCSVLDIAKPDEKILMVSYGSGAGADAFAITVNKEIDKPGRRAAIPIRTAIQNKTYVHYAQYIKHRRKIKTL